MAKIQLNGKKLALKQTISIYQLLKNTKLTEKRLQLRLMVEFYQKIIKKKFIKDKDRIEIVQFIGGG